MKEKILKDLPIFLNGFAVTTLLFGIPNIQAIDIAMYILAMLTFIWYGKKIKTKL
jgi:succinate-acetate transporter protein